MINARRISASVAAVAAGVAMTTLAIEAASRAGVPPETPWACPASHPIKGYMGSDSGRVYFLPEHRFYEEASPERCYASESEARRDGSRPANDVQRGRSLGGVI